MKLLVTGIPGAGKTTIGDYLEKEKGFTHLDYEKPGFRKTAVQAAAIQGSVVISWGFMPGTDDDEVQSLRNAGFKLVWFDGNRESARREFIRRGTVAVMYLDIQMARIRRMDLTHMGALVINTFDKNGEFLPVEEVAALVLQD